MDGPGLKELVDLRNWKLTEGKKKVREDGWNQYKLVEADWVEWKLSEYGGWELIEILKKYQRIRASGSKWKVVQVKWMEIHIDWKQHKLTERTRGWLTWVGKIERYWKLTDVQEK